METFPDHPVPRIKKKYINTCVAGDTAETLGQACIKHDEKSELMHH
jgi:hypothetical protein